MHIHIFIICKNVKIYVQVLLYVDIYVYILLLLQLLLLLMYNCCFLPLFHQHQLVVTGVTGYKRVFFIRIVLVDGTMLERVKRRETAKQWPPSTHPKTLKSSREPHRDSTLWLELFGGVVRGADSG